VEFHGITRGSTTLVRSESYTIAPRPLQLTRICVYCTVTIFTPFLRDWQEVFILARRRSEEMVIQSWSPDIEQTERTTKQATLMGEPR